MKLPPVLVAALRQQAVSAYGPELLRGLLGAFDRREMTAAELIESLRTILELLDAGETFLTGKRKR